jgi:hypothetical protein
MGLGVGSIADVMHVIAGGAENVLETGKIFETFGKVSVPAVEGASGLGAMGLGLGPLGMILGGHEFAEGVEKGDVNKALQGGLGTLGGAAGTVEGVSTLIAAGLGGAEAGGGAALASSVAGAAGTAAPLLAAAALGVGAGTGIAEAADSKYTRSGLWGTDELTGKKKSAMDVAQGWGEWADKGLGGGTLGTIGGATVAGLGSIPMGFAGAGQALWNWLAD